MTSSPESAPAAAGSLAETATTTEHPVRNPGPLVLVDAAGLWFRAFHAVPEKIVAPDGHPVNAVRGFCDMLAAIIDRLSPAEIVLCLDVQWRPAWRVALVPGYKAQRARDDGSEDAPPALGRQVGEILEIVRAAGIATAGADDMEADDVLGTLAARASGEGREVIVVTGDRDLFQVVGPGVRVYYIGAGMSRAELWDEAGVAERHGLPPHRVGAAYAEFAVLRGDAADGLPGVAGIGEKTAARLLRTFSDLEAILGAARDADPAMAAGVRAKLLTGADYARTALEVVGLRTDAAVAVSGDPALPTTTDDDLLAELAVRLGAGRQIDRLVALLR